MSGSKFATGRAQFIVYFTKIDLPYPTLIWQPMYTVLKDYNINLSAYTFKVKLT